MAIIDNLISYWRLDENAANTTVIDSHGSNDATATANTDTFSTAGKIYNAFHYVGSGTPKKTTGEYVVLDAYLSVTSNNYSISFWYKSSESYFQMLFQRVIESDSSNIEFGPSDNTIRVESRTNNYWDKRFATGIDIDDGDWHHYVLVFSSTDSKLYVDGSLADTHTENDDASDFLYRLFGGYGNTTYTYGECPTGDLDEIGIWGRVLLDTEVLEIHNNGRGLTYPFIKNATRVGNTIVESYYGN